MRDDLPALLLALATENAELHHTAAAFDAPPTLMAGADRRVHSVMECVAMLNTLLALLTVLAVMAAHAVYKLLRLPFRLARGLFRHKARPAPLTVR